VVPGGLVGSLRWANQFIGVRACLGGKAVRWWHLDRSFHRWFSHNLDWWNLRGGWLVPCWRHPILGWWGTARWIDRRNRSCRGRRRRRCNRGPLHHRQQLSFRPPLRLPHGRWVQRERRVHSGQLPREWGARLLSSRWRAMRVRWPADRVRQGGGNWLGRRHGRLPPTVHIGSLSGVAACSVLVATRCRRGRLIDVWQTRVPWTRSVRSAGYQPLRPDDLEIDLDGADLVLGGLGQGRVRVPLRLLVFRDPGERL
jgi:hypothetical protein